MIYFTKRRKFLEEKSYEKMRQEFVEFYQQKVAGKLDLFNKVRADESKKLLAFFMTYVSFLLMFGFVMINIFFKFSKIFQNIFTVLAVISGIVAGISLIILMIVTRGDDTNVIKSDYERNLKYSLMFPFLKIFLENAMWRKYPSISLSKLRKEKLLNPYPYFLCDDFISGQFRGVNINIYDGNTNPFGGVLWVLYLFIVIWLTGATNGKFLYVIPMLFLIFIVKIFQFSPFRGLIIEFDMNKNFQYHTFFHEDSITAKKMPIDKNIYKKVDLESVSFENKYDVYSNDQIEARYLLTPSMMERIENLKFTYKAKYVRGSFKNNKLTLAIHTGKDMFAMGSDFKDSDTDTFEELYQEMISVLKIVDELKLNQHIGL